MSQPHNNFQLDPSLRELLALLISVGYSAVLAPINGESALLIHLRDSELGPRPFPVLLKTGLMPTDYGAVIFMQLTVYDQPDRPLALEVLINTDSPDLRECFLALERQSGLALQFFHGYELMATVRIDIASAQGKWALAVREAEAENDRIPVEQRNFERAKAAFIQSVPLMTLPILTITVS